MKKKKNLILFTLCLVLLVTACSQTNKGVSDTETNENVSENTTETISTEVVAEYEEEVSYNKDEPINYLRYDLLNDHYNESTCVGTVGLLDGSYNHVGIPVRREITKTDNGLDVHLVFDMSSPYAFVRIENTDENGNALASYQSYYVKSEDIPETSSFYNKSYKVEKTPLDVIVVDKYTSICGDENFSSNYKEFYGALDKGAKNISYETNFTSNGNNINVVYNYSMEGDNPVVDIKMTYPKNYDGVELFIMGQDITHEKDGMLYSDEDFLKESATKYIKRTDEYDSCEGFNICSFADLMHCVNTGDSKDEVAREANKQTTLGNRVWFEDNDICKVADDGSVSCGQGDAFLNYIYSEYQCSLVIDVIKEVNEG